MGFKSTLGMAALEELKDDQVMNLNAANEGWKGATAGAIAGLFGITTLGASNIVIGAVLKNQVEKLKKEVEQLAHEIEKVAETNGKKAVSEGKITAEDFKKEVKIGSKGIIGGMIKGYFFGPIYTAIKGSELEDLHGELQAKINQLNKILERAQAEQAKGKNGKAGAAKSKLKAAKESNEGEDADKDGDKPEGEGDSGDSGAADADAGDAGGEAVQSEEGATGDDAADATDPTADAPADAESSDGDAGDVDPDAEPGADGEEGEAAPDADADPDADATGGDGGEESGEAGEGAGDDGFDGSDLPDGDAGDGSDAGSDDASGDAGSDDLDAGAGEGGEGDAGAPPDEAAAADASDASATDAAVNAADSTGDGADVVADLDDGDAEADEMVDEMQEVDKIDDNLADVDDDVEKLTVAAESLEGVVAILSASAQRGGLDTFGAALARNNLNTVTTMLKTRPLMIPALEDMEGPSAKIDGANSTKDQVVKFIKKMIDAIKQAFVRVGQWIVETYKRLTSAFVAVERRAEKLAEMVKGSKMKEGKLDNSSLSAKLSVGGRIVENLPQFLTKISKVADYLNDPKNYKPYLEAIDACEAMLKDPAGAEDARFKVSASLKSWGDNLLKLSDSSAEQAEKQNGDTRAFVTELLNNQTFVCKLPQSAEAIRYMSSSVTDAKEASNDGDVQAMSQADALKVCQVVAEIAKHARESGEANRGGVKELVSEIGKRKDTITAMSNAFGERLMKEEGVESESLRKAMLFINTLLMTSPKLPVHAINKALPRNLAAALDYVAASIAGRDDSPAPANAPKLK